MINRRMRQFNLPGALLLHLDIVREPRTSRTFGPNCTKDTIILRLRVNTHTHILRDVQ
jgi:hypothetical protein